MLNQWLLATLLFAASCAALGCGEPGPETAVCTDWQCSRLIPGPMEGTYYCVRGLASGGVCTSDSDCYHQLVCQANATDGIKQCVTAPSSKSAVSGYVSVLVAAVFFGSNYLPVRKMRTGNGVFFQFAMSVGIVVVGLCVQLVRKSPTIYPAAMLGGMLWSMGNCASVRVINVLGVGMAVTTWGCAGMIVGWASGRFGVWGIKAEEPKSEVFSALSVAVGVVAVVLFGFVKPGEGEEAGKKQEEVSLVEDGNLTVEEKQSAAAEPLPASQRLKGFFMAICCGVFYGFTFDPSQSMMDDYGSRSLAEDVKYSPEGLDYAFSAYLGIFVTGLAYMIAVSVLRRWFPTLEKTDITNPMDMFVPAFVSGVMWAIAATAWFIANTNLGLAISYPLVALGPCIVASLWGILYLREISGRRNFMFLGLAFSVAALSCVFTVLSH